MEELEGFDMDVFNVVEDVEFTDNPIEEEEPQDIIENTEKENKISEDVNPEEVANEDGDDEEKDTDKSQSSQKNPYSSLATALAEDGVLPSFDPEKDKIESVEDLIEIFRKEIKSNEFKDLTEDQREYLENIRAGVQPEAFQQIKSVEHQLASITPEELRDNQELRKQIIIADYVEKGIAKEKAEKLAQRSIDIGEDEADALESHESLMTIQKSKLEQQKLDAQQKTLDAQKAHDQQLKTLQDTINRTAEIIPGVKLTDKVKSAVFDQATRPVAKTEDGRMVNAVVKARMEDPVAFETKLNYLFYVTKGFSDFSKIATAQKTRAVRELDDLVKGNSFIPSGKAATQNLDYSPDLDGFDPAQIQNII